MRKADLIRNSPRTASIYNSERKLDSSDYYILNMDIFLTKCINSLQEAFVHPPEQCETLFFNGWALFISLLLD